MKLGRALVAVVLAFSATSAAFSAPQRSAKSRDEASLPTTVLAFSELIDGEEPISTDWLRALFGKKLQCGAYGGYDVCRATDLRLGTQTIGRLNYRTMNSGSILIIDRFAGPCVSTGELAKRFKVDEVANECTDGVACIYANSQRRWGRISVGLPNSKDASDCAEKIVFNSGL
jgi:hypothetical protein